MQNQQLQDFRRLDLDTDPLLVQQGSFRNMANFHLGSSNDGNVGAIEVIRGNESIGDFTTPVVSSIQSVDTVVGKAKDYQNNCVYFFIHNDKNAHKIIKWNALDNTTQLVLEENDVNNPIILTKDSEPTFVSATIYDNQLFWCNGVDIDNSTVPKHLNINNLAEISGSTTYIPEYLSVIKRPPITPLKAIANNVGTDNGNLKDFSYQFTYRFIYDGNEKSRFAPISQLEPTGYDVLTKPNGIDLTYELFGTDNALLEKTVKYIEFAYREFYTFDFKVFKKIPFPTSNTTTGTLRFTGNEGGTAVAQTEYTTEFDNVPLLAKSAAYATGRVMFGNYKQDRYKWRIKTTDGENISYQPNLNSKVLKLGSKYKYAVDFIDKWGRRTTSYVTGEWASGEVAMDINGSITTPKQFGLVDTVDSRLFILDFTDIPDWVEALQFRRTNNLTVDRFIQVRAEHVYYKVADDLNGKPIFVKPINWATQNYDTFDYVANANVGDGGAQELYIDLNNINRSNTFYTFAEGDRVRFLTTGLNNPCQDNSTSTLPEKLIDLPIKRQEGRIIVCDYSQSKTIYHTETWSFDSNSLDYFSIFCGEDGYLAWCKDLSGSQERRQLDATSTGWSEKIANTTFYSCDFNWGLPLDLPLVSMIAVGEGLIVSCLLDTTTRSINILYEDNDIVFKTISGGRINYSGNNDYAYYLIGGYNKITNRPVLFVYTPSTSTFTDISTEITSLGVTEPINCISLAKSYYYFSTTSGGGSILTTSGDNNYYRRGDIQGHPSFTTIEGAITFDAPNYVVKISINLSTLARTFQVNSYGTGLLANMPESCKKYTGCSAFKSNINGSLSYFYVFIGENGMKGIYTDGYYATLNNGLNTSLRSTSDSFSGRYNGVKIKQGWSSADTEWAWYTIAICGDGGRIEHYAAIRNAVDDIGKSGSTVISGGATLFDISIRTNYYELFSGRQQVYAAGYFCGAKLFAFSYSCGIYDGYYEPGAFTSAFSSTSIPFLNNGFVYNYGSMIEIYTPAKATTETIYYEVGNVIKKSDLPNTGGLIQINLGANNNDYELLTPPKQNFADGDTFFIEKQFYGRLWTLPKDRILSMSPTKDTWSQWDKDTGRPNVEDLSVDFASDGTQAELPYKHFNTSITFSNNYVQGTKVNGLSSFEPLNYKQFPIEYGGIYALQLASNTNEDGKVLLAIHQLETNSIYLGKVQFTDVAGQNVISLSDQVLGSYRTTNANVGTINPESICEHNGAVYGFDALKGVFWKYSQAGQDKISNVLIRNFAYRLGKEYTSGNLNQYRPIVSEYDNYFDEVLFSLSTIESDRNVNTTVVWSEKLNNWIGFQDLSNENDDVPKMFANLNNRFVSVLNDSTSYETKVFLHNSENVDFALMYGNQKTPRVSPIFNMGATQSKAWNNISVQSNCWLNMTSCDNEVKQDSELIGLEEPFTNTPGDWRKLENVYYAGFLRDKNSVPFTYPLLEGDVLRSRYLITHLEVDTSQMNSADLLKVYNAKVGFSLSKK